MVNWRSTRISIGSVTSEALRGSSSGWPSTSASGLNFRDGRAPQASFPNTGPGEGSLLQRSGRRRVEWVGILGPLGPFDVRSGVTGANAWRRKPLTGGDFQTPATGANASLVSTSWGSLVRAQYRPPNEGPATAGLSSSPGSTLGERVCTKCARSSRKRVSAEPVRRVLVSPETARLGRSSSGSAPP